MRLLSHENNQGGAHAHLVNEETGRQLEEFVVEDMKEENEDSMIVLSPWYENIKSLEREFANKEQKIDVAQGDIFKDIQEFWVEAISTTVPGAISKVITEVEVEKAEESNQQFKYEWTTCREMQWQSM